jgi:hypothetical protein
MCNLNFGIYPLTIVQDNSILSSEKSVSLNGGYTVGSQTSFWAEDTWKAFNTIDDDDDGLVDFSDGDYNEGIYSIDAEVVNVTSDVVIFVDQSLAIPLYRSKIHSLAGRCSDITITIESSLASIPDHNSDSRVIIIITDIRDEAYYSGGSCDFILGYFWPVHSTSTSSSGIRQYSHDSEIIYLDINPVSTGDVSLAAEILSHELQHLVQFSYHPDQDLWLDEGLSVQTEVLCGYNTQSDQYHDSFSSQPFKSLIFFDRTLSSYGFSSLFIRYLIDHFGTGFLSTIYKETEIGMFGIINTLQDLGHPEITSSELFINFSIALWLQDPNNSWFNLSTSSVNLVSPELITTFPSEQLWTIPSWGFWVKNIGRINKDKVLHISFDSLKPYDSLDNHALFYVTIVHKTANQSHSMNHWLMDPVIGDSQFLFSFPNTSTQVFLLVNAFAGTAGGPLPTFTVPTINGSLTLSTREASQSFSFPGYIARYTDTQEILVSSIRYYSKGDYEWTPDNTIIAKWRLLKDEFPRMKATGIIGNLEWSQSGWYIPLLSIDTLSHGNYYFEFEFFNGSKNHSFLSDLLDLSNSNSNLDTLLLPLMFGGGLVSFIGLAVFLTKKYNVGQSSYGKSKIFNEKTKTFSSEKPMKLSKLKPLFLGEKKDINKVKIDVFKKRRRK